jgi:hypothetical protein
MDVSYDLYVRHEVYHALRSLSRSHREVMLSFIESLPANPFRAGDFTETDQAGRPCQVILLGKYALYFWADHAAKEIRVIDLIDADRT